MATTTLRATRLALVGAGLAVILATAACSGWWQLGREHPPGQGQRDPEHARVERHRLGRGLQGREQGVRGQVPGREGQLLVGAERELRPGALVAPDRRQHRRRPGGSGRASQLRAPGQRGRRRAAGRRRRVRRPHRRAVHEDVQPDGAGEDQVQGQELHGAHRAQLLLRDVLQQEDLRGERHPGADDLVRADQRLREAQECRCGTARHRWQGLGRAQHARRRADPVPDRAGQAGPGEGALRRVGEARRRQAAAGPEAGRAAVLVRRARTSPASPTRR